MTPDLILGIDPGQAGGFALLTLSGEIVAVWPMPETERDVCEGISEFAPRIATVALEKVNAFTGKDRTRGVASTAKFMQGYGFLRGVLTVLQLRVEDIRPQVWQQSLGCLTGGKKAVTRQKAQQLFPRCHVRITNKIADALLIAEYARRQN